MHDSERNVTRSHPRGNPNLSSTVPPRHSFRHTTTHGYTSWWQADFAPNTIGQITVTVPPPVVAVLRHSRFVVVVQATERSPSCSSGGGVRHRVDEKIVSLLDDASNCRRPAAIQLTTMTTLTISERKVDYCSAHQRTDRPTDRVRNRVRDPVENRVRCCQAPRRTCNVPRGFL
jgi:hypothetical protein